jgi:RND family efflux transporter MFP subunit
VTGTVRAARDITLRPRIEGEIVERSRSFTPGAMVRKGEVLLRIDPRDYEIALKRAKSDMRRAIADLQIERGRQDVARKDYQLLEESLSGENKALVLREPQLDSAKAAVASARASVERAELDLERTRIRAPFDARVLSREVNLGSQVSPGDGMARLVGTDTFWVEATVPLDKLAWLEVPEILGGRGSRVRIRNQGAWPPGTHRTGRLDRLVGTLEEETRMARVLVSVKDPLARETSGPALILGSYVRARIHGAEIRDVVRLDRDLLRKQDTVWVMDQGRLDVRAVDIALKDADHAYIESGLSGGERVVVSQLATVEEGKALRLKKAQPGRDERRDNATRGSDSE